MWSGLPTASGLASSRAKRENKRYPTACLAGFRGAIPRERMSDTTCPILQGTIT